MNKILFTLAPTFVSGIYVVAQFIVQAITGRMYFSSTFALELILYALIGLAYVFFVFKTYRAYLPNSIAGFLIGIVVFVAAGMKLFLMFEFGRDLSI